MVRISVCENDNSRVLFSLLRIIEADHTDFKRLSAASGRGVASSSFRSIRDAQQPVSVRNEMRSMKHLKSICEEYLELYPSSLEEDCRRLADTSSSALAPFSNERHALIQVRGEKEVLLFYKDFADTAIRLLELRDGAAFELELATVTPSKHLVVQQYLSNVICKLRQEERVRTEIRQRNVDFSRPTIV